MRARDAPPPDEHRSKNTCDEESKAARDAARNRACV
jgi:hypothetical protein